MEPEADEIEMHTVCRMSGLPFGDAYYTYAAWKLPLQDHMKKTIPSCEGDLSAYMLKATPGFKAEFKGKDLFLWGKPLEISDAYKSVLAFLCFSVGIRWCNIVPFLFVSAPYSICSRVGSNDAWFFTLARASVNGAKSSRTACPLSDEPAGNGKSIYASQR